MNATLNDSLDDIFPAHESPAPRALPQGNEWDRIRALDGAAPVAKPYEETCSKCRGSGRFIGYTGRPLGPCFACKGRGKKSFATAPTVRAAARDRAAAKPANRWDAFVAQYPAEAAVLVKGIAQTYGDGRWNATCSDIKGKVEKYGDLHEGTMAMLGRAVARDAERAAGRVQQAAQQQERVAGIDVANIADCFKRAHEAGLKRFTLRFADAHFQVDRNDPTLIWVSQGGYGTAKYGRIQGGVYKAGRDVNPTVLARIAAISQDPMAAAAAFAQITSSCSVCGRHLENQDSVDAGIGPVCAGRLNRPGLKFVPVDMGEF